MMARLPDHDDTGHGRPVVLLHAGVADRGMWDPQVDALAASCRVVRADLRGFGATPLLPGDFSHADDIIALLGHVAAGPSVLVGASFGGGVALEVAATRPDLVAGLVLLSPAVAGGEAGPDLVAFGAEEDELLEAGDIDAAVELNVSTWLGPEATPESRDRLRGMQRHAFEVHLRADALEPPPQPISRLVDLHAVAVPALVVSGGLDLAHFQHVARQLVDEMPSARHHHLPWAGHLPSIERPEAISDLLRDYLSTRV